jgi:hypothetical protein
MARKLFGQNKKPFFFALSQRPKMRSGKKITRAKTFKHSQRFFPLGISA